MSTLCTTVDCINNLIIVDACTSGGLGSGSHSFDVTFPDGTTSTMNNSLPFNFTFTSQGAHTIYGIIDGDGYTGTATVQCGKGGPGGKGNPCDSIAGISSCVFSLNERYEELKCNNDKKAEEEKIKLDRVIQLLSLAENDCECGIGMVYEYINEINSIANCDDCDRDFSMDTQDGYGCTDPAASNYDSSATTDDGSCLYAQSCVSVTMPNRSPWNGASQTETLVPDPLFEAFLELNGYGNGVLDGKVCTANINNDSHFTCSGFSINDATGIGDMVNYPVIQMLFENNNLSTIDVSQNIDLIRLTVQYNELTSILGLTNLSVLYNLDLERNELTSVDLSGNPILERLNLRWNNLSSLDISNNPLLTGIALHDNNLITLDTSNNPALTVLGITSNHNLNSLDFTNNINLTYLMITHCDLTTLDVSMCTNLVRLYGKGNSNLITLNLGSNIDLSILLGGTAPGRSWDGAFRIELSASNLNIKVGTGYVPGTTGGSGTGTNLGLQTRVEYATEKLTHLMTVSSTTYGAWTQYTITT